MVANRNDARQITHREDAHFRPRHECSDRQSLTQRRILRARQQNRNGIVRKNTPRRAKHEAACRHLGMIISRLNEHHPRHAAAIPPHRHIPGRPVHGVRIAARRLNQSLVHKTATQPNRQNNRRRDHQAFHRPPSPMMGNVLTHPPNIQMARL
jgi:hypothetical protein